MSAERLREPFRGSRTIMTNRQFGAARSASGCDFRFSVGERNKLVGDCA